MPEPGETFINACDTLPLHAGPDGFSEVVGAAGFGDEFTVAGKHGKYLIPKSLRYSERFDAGSGAEAKQARGKGPQYHERDFFYTWAEVRTADGTAHAAMRCMVSPAFFEQQNAEDAERKFASARVVQAGKGFNLKPASGGAGKGLAGQLASAGADKSTVAYLVERAESNPHQAFAEFRKEGQLGEHSPYPVEPELRKRPARDIDTTPEDASLGDAMDKLF